MKKIIPGSLVLCLTACIIVLSCKKQNTTVNYNYIDIFDGLRDTAQRFEVQAGTDTTVFGINGTALHFYPNSFKDGSGNIVTGTVKVQLTEIPRTGDMIMNSLWPLDINNEVLQSGGQVRVFASKDGPGAISPNVYGLGFKQPAAAAQPMQLYFVRPSTSTSLEQKGIWYTADSSNAGTFVPGTKNFNAGAYYTFDSCTQFSYINCDYRWQQPTTKINLTVTVPGALFNPGNTRVCIVYPSINSTLPLRLEALGVYRDDIRVPNGGSFTVVAIAYADDKYYYFEQKGLTASNRTVNAAMTAVAKDDFVAKLKGL